MKWFIFMFGLSLAAQKSSESPDAGPPSDTQQLKLMRGGCPMFWYNFKGRCYKYFGGRLTWAEAELHCVSEGANLVSIHSLEEHNFVIFMIKNFDPTKTRTLIGLTDLHWKGGWLWSDGSKYEYSLWDRGQPDNFAGEQACGATNFGSLSYWDDVSCFHGLPFVCASRTVCP